MIISKKKIDEMHTQELLVDKGGNSLISEFCYYILNYLYLFDLKIKKINNKLIISNHCEINIVDLDNIIGFKVELEEYGRIKIVIEEKGIDIRKMIASNCRPNNLKSVDIRKVVLIAMEGIIECYLLEKNSYSI